MHKLSERGVVHLLVPLILLGGIIAGVYLVTAGPLKIFPKAGGPISGPISGPIPYTYPTPYSTPPSPCAGICISANPNPVPVGSSGLGTTKVTWNTGGGDGQVFVSVDGKPEELFAQNPSGVQDAPWIQLGHSYEFMLYEGTTRSTLLTSVIVEGESEPPSICTIQQFAASFGSRRGDNRYVPSCDVNSDSAINFFDIYDLIRPQPSPSPYTYPTPSYGTPTPYTTPSYGTPSYITPQ